MDENPTLSEAVFSAISNWLGEDGLATGFLLVFPTVDADGSFTTVVCKPDDQPPPTSLGLIGFAEEFIRDDIRRSWYSDHLGGGE